MSKNKDKALVIRIVTLVLNILRTGNSKAISTSKIRNNTTSKKNRVENGERIFLNGSNPHSKGVNFSPKSEYLR